MMMMMIIMMMMMVIEIEREANVSFNYLVLITNSYDVYILNPQKMREKDIFVLHKFGRFLF